MSEQDVSGLEFTVNADNAVGDGEGGIKVIEDEWLPAVLSNFSTFKNSFGQDQLRWNFELQGKEYTWFSKKSGKSGQFKVSCSTSKVCSPKSRLYKMYSKLIGREPAQGERISLQGLVGMHCFVMIKHNKQKLQDGTEKIWNNVDKVKSAGQTAPKPIPVPVAQPQQQPVPSAQPVAPQQPVTPPPTVFMAKPVAAGGTVDLQDIFG